MHWWTFPVYVVVHKNIKNFVKYNKQFEIDGIYSISKSHKLYPCSKCHSVKTIFNTSCIWPFHLLDIQLSISGAILTEYR